MPLDTSIPLQVRGVQLADPMQMQAQALQLRELAALGQDRELQRAEAERKRQQDRTLADLYRNSTGPDGKINREALITGAAQQGLGAQIPGLQKQFTEQAKAEADVANTNSQIDERKLTVARKRLEASGAALSSLLSRPNVTHQDVIVTVQGLVNAGIIPPEEGAGMVRELPGRPEQLREYLMTKGLEVMDASKRIDLMLPKTDIRDTGGAQQIFQTNQLTGQVTPGQAFQKTVSPDAVLSAQTSRSNAQLSAATTRRGQDLTDNRAAETNRITAANKAVNLNDVQAKALLFGTRMQEAGKVFDQNPTVQPSLIKRGAEAVPLVGEGLGMLANATVVSPEQQQIEQAQRDFVNAVLRRESGAAISAPEFANATKQYFPQPGDSPQVIAQKKRNREQATALMLEEVPAARRNPAAVQGGATGQWGAGVPQDIAAILNKHGAK